MKYATTLLLALAFSVAVQGQDPAHFWEATHGLEGTSVNTLAVSDTGVLFAGTLDGAFRSLDDGDTWTLLSNGLPQVPVFSFAINTAGDVFAGTTGAGIFRSSDEGQTWIEVNTGLSLSSKTTVLALAIDNEGDIFAGTSGMRLYRSADNAKTWTDLRLIRRIPVYILDDYLFSLSDMIINTEGEIFLWALGGPFRSDDKGETWAEIPAGVVFSFALNASGDVFAGSCGAGLFRSSDKGQTWITKNEGLPEHIALNIMDLAINAEGDLFASVSTGGGWCLDAKGEGVYRSEDNGESWIAVNAGLPTLSVKSLAVGPKGRLFAGTDGHGVFRSVETTTPVTVEGRTSDVPQQFALAQNYPNPFNPSTTFAFDLPQTGPVALHIYSVLGEVVATVVDESLPAGRYQRRWDASGLASGVYLYRLEAAGFMQTKALTLLR